MILLATSLVIFIFSGIVLIRAYSLPAETIIEDEVTLVEYDHEGKFDYLEVLDAQRTLFDARVQYVSSLTTYHKTRAAIERLIGRGLDTMNDDAGRNEEGGTSDD